MATITTKYLGNLRCECTHVASGATIITDAPKDNHGTGQGFSATDLLCTSLCVCISSAIGIYAKLHDCDVTGMEMAATKHLLDKPRRFAKIEVVVTMPDREYAPRQKASIEHCAKLCTVHRSLAPEIEQDICFVWQR